MIRIAFQTLLILIASFVTCYFTGRNYFKPDIYGVTVYVMFLGSAFIGLGAMGLLLTIATKGIAMDDQLRYNTRHIAWKITEFLWGNNLKSELRPYTYCHLIVRFGLAMSLCLIVIAFAPVALWIFIHFGGEEFWLIAKLISTTALALLAGSLTVALQFGLMSTKPGETQGLVSCLTIFCILIIACLLPTTIFYGFSLKESIVFYVFVVSLTNALHALFVILDHLFSVRAALKHRRNRVCPVIYANLKF